MRCACSEFSMHFHVARTTKRDKVISRMSSTVSKRDTVVNFLRRGVQTFPQTLLTKRVCLDVPVTNPLPSTTVSLPGFRVASVVVVLIIIRSLMRRAVKLTVLGEVGAARLPARPPRFLWHPFTSISGQREKPSISRRLVFLF